MCYKSPGPRCSSHAATALMRAIENEKRVPYSDMEARIEAKETTQAAWDVYDTTPAGQEFLKRKIKHKQHPLQEYKDRLALGKFRREAALKDAGIVDSGDTYNHVPDGVKQTVHHHFNEGFLEDNQPRISWNVNTPEGREKIDAMIEHSHSWVSQLNADEMEAVAYYTSNGASTMNKYLRGDEEIESVYSKREIAKRAKNLASALAKTPQLDKPVVVYRGLQSWDGENIKVDEYIAKHPVGSVIEGKVNASASFDPGVASGFADDIILEISTKTPAAVSNVSAWGTREREALLAAGDKFRVKAIKQGIAYGDKEDTVEKRWTTIQLEQI